MRGSMTMRVAGWVVAATALVLTPATSDATPVVNVIVAQIAEAHADLADQRNVLADLDEEIAEQHAVLARLKHSVGRHKRPGVATAIAKVEAHLANLERQRAEVQQVISDFEEQIQWLYEQLELWQPSGSDES